MSRLTTNLIVRIPTKEVDQAEINRLFTAAIETITQHNHDTDKGLKIPNARIEFSDDSEINNKKLKNIASCVFSNEEPETIENNSMYFKEGDCYIKDNSGNEIQITKHGKINNLILNVDTGDTVNILYGFSSSVAALSRNKTMAESLVNTSFNNPAQRNTRTINSLLIGGRVQINAPVATGYYWPWIAVKTTDLQNTQIFYSTDFENQTNFWHSLDRNIGAINYKVFYNEINIENGTRLDFILRTFT